VTPDHERSALFVTALLSAFNDLTWQERALVISRVAPFDIHSDTDVIEGLRLSLVDREGFVHSVRRSKSSLVHAATKAEQWIYQGIFVLTFEDLGIHESFRETIPPTIYAKGDRSILDMPIAAILNSRKPLRIHPDDRWLVATQSLVRMACREGYAIASSYGSMPYNLVSRMSACEETPVVGVCDNILPFMGTEKSLALFNDTYRDLFPDGKTLFLSSFSPGSSPSRAVRFQQRDDIVAALSSSILVAEVRAGGNMTRMMESAVKRNAQVTLFLPEIADNSTAGNHQFLEKYPAAGARIVSQESLQTVEDHLAEPSNHTLSRDTSLQVLLNPLAKGEHLIHYTRSCPGPWPGQSLAEFCQSLIDGCCDSAHTAFDTLMRILGENLIRGSHKLVRGNDPVVSFTECLPYTLDELIKWRPGLIRWSFEPYGVAIRMQALTPLRVEPAIYGTEEVFDQLTEERRFLFQLVKPEGNDWSIEKEWRLRGDLRLSDLPREDVTVVVPRLEEAMIIQQEFGLAVTLGTANEALVAE
jgi:predicted Rossmann fold nucleotide-binding protein DprA/Smf involved in DNA uptake